VIDHARFAARGKTFAVATPHRSATDAAVAAFHAGGNSVDAALAASAVLAVVYPHMCGIGGDLFALVADRGTTVALNGSGAAAAALEVDWVRREYGSMPTHGPQSISVPGTVAAWNELATRFGRLSLAAAIAPAIALAQDGVPLARSVARSIVKNQERLSQDAAISDLMMPDGRPLEIGQPLVQPALAATLRAIATSGPNAFYDGPVGRRLVAGLASMGSRLADADFRRHSTEITAPLAMAYRGLEVLVPPPNSQGFVLLEILGCVEHGRLIPDHLGPDAATLAHIFLLASSDRDNFLADPRYGHVPIDDLLSAQHADELVAQAEQLAGPGSLSRRATGDTVGIVAVEEEGPWVAINHSLYDAFGSGILEPSTGIICHNRGSYFSLDRSAPNVLVGAKRPAHTLMPVMVMRDGRPIVASATMGGSAHAQIHAEVLLAVLDRGVEIADAISLPRWLVGGMQRHGGSGIVAESRVPPGVVGKMTAADFGVQTLDAWDEQVGHAQMAMRTDDGWLSAASDPRADGSAGAG